MKEAIGGIPIFQIAIILILLFAGIMALTINQSRTFAVKDEVITVIESGGYVDSQAIASKLQEVGYRTTGNCPSGFTGYDRNGSESSIAPTFCIRAIDGRNGIKTTLDGKCSGSCTGDSCVATANDCEYLGNLSDFPEMNYYEVVLFYQLDIPILNQFFNFKMTGSTKTIMK